MSEPDQELMQQLKATLDDHASEAPMVDLSDASLRQAGRMRTHRRVAAGLVAAALVAIALPVGIQLSDTTSDGRDTATEPTDEIAPVPAPPIDVTIDGLAAGAPPSVPYVDGDTFNYDEATVTLEPTNGIVTDVVPLNDGVVVFSQDPITANVTYSTNGASSALPQGDSATKPAVDPANGKAVWAVQKKSSDQDTLVYAGDLTSDVTSVQTPGLRIRQVMGVNDGEVFFNASRGGTPVVGYADVNAQTVDGTAIPALAVASAVSPDLSQLAGRLTSMTGPKRSCTAMVEADNGNAQWSNCQWRPVEFSSDGSRVLAFSSDTEGLGINSIAVMDSSTGDVVQRFTTAGTFGRMTFENPETVIGVVAVGAQASIVRCTVGGDCQLATAVAKVALDDPDSVLRPYQLTAN